MSKLFVAIFRTGGRESFSWNRALPVETRELAEKQAEEIRRGGRPCHVESLERSLAIGLPETFEPAAR
jgi:hypothetical protein